MIVPGARVIYTPKPPALAIRMYGTVRRLFVRQDGTRCASVMWDDYSYSGVEVDRLVRDYREPSPPEAA